MDENPAYLEVGIQNSLLDNSNHRFAPGSPTRDGFKTRPEASGKYCNWMANLYYFNTRINHRLFGDVVKSKKAHFAAGFAGTIVYLILTNMDEFEAWSIPRSLSIWIIFSFLTDGDTEFNHRNWMFHSLVFPLLFTISFWGIPNTSFSLFIVGLHLLCDIRSKNPRGYYCIHLWKGNTLNVGETRWWLRIWGLLGVLTSIFLEVSF